MKRLQAYGNPPRSYGASHVQIELIVEGENHIRMHGTRMGLAADDRACYEVRNWDGPVHEFLGLYVIGEDGWMERPPLFEDDELAAAA